MKRIAFIINSLGSGGAERVLQIILEDSRTRSDLDVHLVLLDDLPRFRTIPGHVTVHQLSCGMRLLPSIIALYSLLRRIRPDVGVSFLVRANIVNAIVSRCLSYRSVLLERMHLSSHLRNHYSGWKLQVSQILPRLFYRLADAVSGVSSGVTLDLARKFAVPASRLSTVENPFDIGKINADAREPISIRLPRDYMVAVGRLARSKDYRTLITAFHIADPQIPLVILGEGDEKEALQALIEQKGLSGRVLLMGYVANPLAIMAGARCYVSASTNEGFPNSLVEAMCLGLPVIATNCPSGPAEILHGNADLHISELLEAPAGMLVPVKAPHILATAINRMMDPDVAAHYSERSKKRAHDYESRKILDAYWKLFIL